MEEEKLKKMCEEVAKKQSWIRQGVEKIMTKWAEITAEVEGEYIAYTDIIKKRDFGGYIEEDSAYIKTGEKDIFFYDGIDSRERAFSNYAYFWDEVSIDELKTFCENFQGYVKEIMKKMEERKKLCDEIAKIQEKYL